jgi:ribonuclease D
MNLKKLGQMYCGVDLDKSIRGKIIYQGLTNEIIKYAAEDTAYLEDIMSFQQPLLKEKNLTIAVKYENAFILPLAYMEYCGIKLDKDK